jgi:hypothetical protein
MLLLASFLLVGLFQIFFPYYPIRIGPFRILPLDFVYFPMIIKIAGYTLKHPKSMAKLARENCFLIAFLAMVAVYVIVYTPLYGQSAIGEARKYYFTFLVPLIALISVKSPEDLRRLFLALVSVACYVGLFALIYLGMQGTIVRILSQEQTLTLVFVAFTMLVHRIHKMVIVTPLMDTVLLLLFSVIVIGSGQRSCWLAVGLGLMLMVGLYHQRAVLFSKMVMIALVGIMGVTSAMIMLPEARSRLVEKFSGIVDPYEDKNASWRIRGWEAQLATVKQNLFFGEGVGNYYSWKFRGEDKQYNPHNAYVQMTVKFGLFGLILYSLLVVQFFRKMLRVRRKLRPGPMKAYIETAILTFGAAHAYMLGYGIHPFTLTFFAVGICAASLSQQALRRSEESRIPPLPGALKTRPRRSPLPGRPEPRPLYS